MVDLINMTEENNDEDKEEDTVYTPEEELEVKKRLESLGYLD